MARFAGSRTSNRRVLPFTTTEFVPSTIGLQVTFAVVLNVGAVARSSPFRCALNMSGGSLM